MNATTLVILVATSLLLTAPSLSLASDGRYGSGPGTTAPSRSHESRSVTYRSPARQWHGSGYRHHHVRPRVYVYGNIGWGPVWGPWPWPYGYYYYPAYPHYGAVPTITQQTPETNYIEQEQSADVEDSRYYCRNPEGYYPAVPRCPSGWQKVGPAEGIPGEEE